MNTAPVKWAQRKDSIYLTITLADVKDHKIDLAEKKLTFEGNSSGKPYSLNLEFVSIKYLLMKAYSFNYIIDLLVQGNQSWRLCMECFAVISPNEIEQERS